MEKLRKSCVKLKILELRYSDLNSLKCTAIPNGLEELRLFRCEIPLKWFEKNQFLNLSFLDLSKTSGICSTHLNDLAASCKNTLKVLILKECYRIDDKAIEVLVNENFVLLNRLDLEETSITQYGLQLLCTKLAGTLGYLNIKNCKKLNLNNQMLNFVNKSFSSNESFILIN